MKALLFFGLIHHYTFTPDAALYGPATLPETNKTRNLSIHP